MPDSEQKTGVKTRYGSLTGKEVIFIFLSGIILVVDGILFTNLFVNHFFLQVGPVDYILPLIGMIGFAIVFSVLAILSSQPWMSLVIYLIASILSVSFVPVRWESFVASALIFSSLAYAFFSIRSSYIHSATFHASSAIRAGLASVFTALALLASFCYFYGQILRPPRLFSPELIRDVVGTAVKVAGEKFEGTLQGLKDQALKEIAPQRIPFSQLLSEFRTVMDAQTPDLAARRDAGVETENILSIPFEERIAMAIEMQIDKFMRSYRPILPYAFAFFFYFAMKGVTYFLYWLALPITVMVLRFFTVVGIARKEKVQIEVERVSF